MTDEYEVLCPHGQCVMRSDPERFSREDVTLVVVDPWPCSAEGCTADALNEELHKEAQREWNAYMEELMRRD